MKKLGLMLAAATLAASASAQTVTGSKTFDNMYVGVNGGVMTFTKGHKWLAILMQTQVYVSVATLLQYLV